MKPVVDCIVFCSGKCGSTTLLNTLRKNKMISIKLHGKADFKNLCKNERNWKIYNNVDELIKISSKNKKLYIIDSYRLPIERKISGFFQNIHKYIKDYDNKPIEDIIEIFNKKYLFTIENYHSINYILDDYKLEHFKNFNFSKRIVKKELNNLVFIKILFRDINRWDNILSKIFNKKITLYSKNMSKCKNYKSIYEEFKKKYKLPKKFINKYLLNDKEFKIYNTKKEQEEYIKKWLDRSY